VETTVAEEKDVKAPQTAVVDIDSDAEKSDSSGAEEEDVKAPQDTEAIEDIVNPPSNNADDGEEEQQQSSQASEQEQKADADVPVEEAKESAAMVDEEVSGDEDKITDPKECSDCGVVKSKKGAFSKAQGKKSTGRCKQCISS
jgi:hypothetical protein